MNPIPCPYCGETMEYKEWACSLNDRVNFGDTVLRCRATCPNPTCPRRTTSIFGEPCSVCFDMQVPAPLDGERMHQAWETLRADFARHTPDIKRLSDARLARELDTQPR